MFYSNSINSANITVPTNNGLYLVLELPEIGRIVIIRPHYEGHEGGVAIPFPTQLFAKIPVPIGFLLKIPVQFDKIPVSKK